MLRMCVLTVFGETDRSRAISSLDRFVGRYRSTLSSPGLSSSVARRGRPPGAPPARGLSAPRPPDVNVEDIGEQRGVCRLVPRQVLE